MTEPDFRAREVTDPPHGYRPVWPPRPPRPAPPSRWDRLWRRLRGLLRRPRRHRRLAVTAVGSLHPADVARILAECVDREQGEEP